MSHESKMELARALRGRYLRASRAEKGRMVDEFVALTDYHRKYALALLRHGPPIAGTGAAHRRGRRPRYGPPVVAALQVAAQATGWICGKTAGGGVGHVGAGVGSRGRAAPV